MDKRTLSLPLIVALAVNADSFAQSLDNQQKKAVDVERLLANESLKYVQQPSRDYVLGGNCLPPDTDDDGMPDSWEVAHGLDPMNPDDAWFDSDGDGVINLFEFQLGADPNDPASPPVKTVGRVGADFTRISDAIDRVAPGTLIRVARGVYQENYLTFSEKIVMVQGGWSED